MTNITGTSIVVVNASVIQNPVPDTLQQRGGFITQGGSTLAPGTEQLVSTLAELLAIIAPALSISSLSWSGNIVTVTTTSPHGWHNGDAISILIAGAAPAGYNGKFVGTVTGANTLTYPLVGSPGAETTLGTVQLWASSELTQMGTTYFAGVGVPSVNVVELGEGVISAGVTALTTYIINALGTSGQNYSYLVPREWDGDSSFLNFLANYTGVSKMQYFYVTCTNGTKGDYATLKCVFAEVESPSVSATEFSLASAFGTALKQNPSSTNKLVPLTYSPSFGTTAYPVRGNQSVLSGFALANVGWIGTGQQGGLSGNIIFQGKMCDGNFWNFWYSVDWMQIQSAQALANEVINGSATSLNPLYYNQAGINRLQQRVVNVATQGVTFGVGNGQVVATQLPAAQFLANYNAGLYADQIVVNAEPFSVYTAENPNDYGEGLYAGLSCIWIPQLPFLQVVFNLMATTLLVG